MKNALQTITQSVYVACQAAASDTADTHAQQHNRASISGLSAYNKAADALSTQEDSAHERQHVYLGSNLG